MVDLRQGRLVASLKITGGRESEMSYCDAIAWHPSQQGFIIDCDIALEDESSFQQAGFAVAALPGELHIGAGFSADAGHLVASWLDKAVLDVHSKRYCVVACSLEGQQVHFGERYELSPANTVQWMPGSSSLLLQMPGDSDFPSCMATGPFRAPQFHYLAEPLGELLLLSPSAKFLAERGSGGVRIVELAHGQQVWDASSSALPNLSKRERESAEGIFGLENKLAEVRLRILCWLPSGLGILCHPLSDRRRAGSFNARLIICWFA